jgi:hypothetical protein
MRRNVFQLPSVAPARCHLVFRWLCLSDNYISRLHRSVPPFWPHKLLRSTLSDFRRLQLLLLLRLALQPTVSALASFNFLSLLRTTCHVHHPHAFSFCVTRSFFFFFFCLQMDLIRRFDNAVLYKTVKILSLEIGRRYEILSAERVTTRYGPSVLLTITLGTSSSADSVPSVSTTRYTNVITDDDITAINMRQVLLYLVYKGTCTTTHSYMLQLVS